jgi:predicted ribosomally synthesized peptide with SipW-like signal peptide
VRRRRHILVAAVAGALALGSAAAFAYFTATVTTPQPISVAQFSSLPSDTSIVPSWKIDDNSGGGTTAIYTPAFADALFLKTSSPALAFAANRYVDVDFANFAPTGQTADRVTAEVDFADDNGDAKTSCMYMEVRRASTGAVLETHGSPTAPLGCQPLDTAFTVSQPLAVKDTNVANDLRLRIYFDSAGTNAIRLYRAVVKVVLLGRTWTLLPATTDDALDSTPTGSVPWGLSRVDTTAYRNAANWGNAYDARKYLALVFPDTVPIGATLTNVQLDVVWKTANAARHCLIAETYAGGNLLATHGTPAAPAMCTTSSTAWSTNTVPLPEVNSAERADDLTVRLYGWGGNRIDFDRVAIRMTWSVGTFGCVDPDAETIEVSRDSWADQNAPASTNGDTDRDLKVRSEASRNRRVYVHFPLPSLPNGCKVTNATLKLFQNGVQEGGLRTIDVYRAASSWTEGGLSWNTAPATTGAAAGATNALVNNTTVTWDVTPLVNAAASGTNNGFVLRDRAENASRGAEQKFDSREGPTKPQLIITFGDE